MKKLLVSLLLVILVGLSFSTDVGLSKLQVEKKYGSDYVYSYKGSGTINESKEDFTYNSLKLIISFGEDELVTGTTKFHIFDSIGKYTNAKNKYLGSASKYSITREIRSGIIVFDFTKGSSVLFNEDKLTIVVCEIKKDILKLMVDMIDSGNYY